MKHVLLLVLPLTLLAHMGFGQCILPVIYGKEVTRSAQHPRANVTRVFLDLDGSLYPPSQAGVEVDSARLSRYNVATLTNYFQATVPKDWTVSAQKQQLHQLETYYKVAPAPGASLTTPHARLKKGQLKKQDLDVWYSLQLAMQKSVGDELAQKLAATPTAALVVLVHGFNNKFNEVSWYGFVEKRLQETYFPSQHIEFLEVFWDGGSSTGLGAVKDWPNAQATMYPVGLALRRLLWAATSRNPDVPLRLIGHSTGAPILAITLWNSTGALQTKHMFGLSKHLPSIYGRPYTLDFLHEAAANTMPSARDVRVAMVAPAMTASHFYCKYTDRTPTGSVQVGDPYTRFVIGQNREDRITRKMILRPSFLGDTRLGFDTDAWRDVVKSTVAQGSATKFYQVDFTDGIHNDSVASSDKQGHSINTFLQVPAQTKCLLDAWLLPGPPSCALECGVPPALVRSGRRGRGSGNRWAGRR